MKISEEMIKKSCSQTIYRRGLEYFKQGRVHLKQRDDASVTADVDGDKLYHVSVKIENDHVSEYFCTCPYHETMDCVCKHIVAVLKQRQAELSSQNGADPGQALSAGLWNRFSALAQPKERMHVQFLFSIRTAMSIANTYGVSLRLNLKPLSNPETFLDCVCRERPYTSHSRTIYDPAVHTFGPRETELLKILAEAYQSRAAHNPYYVKSAGEICIGSESARRIFPLLEGTDYQLEFNGVQQGRCMLHHQNPDILVDVTAGEDGIVLSMDHYGTAVVPDGSVFFYEDEFYLTDSAWRRWFMPLYAAMAPDSRSILSFTGENAQGFAAYVLPVIREQRGVTADGVDQWIVREKPVFTAYLDRRGEGIICTLTADYGDVSLRLPDGDTRSGKIVVRDMEAEQALIDQLKSFTYRNGVYQLNGDQPVFDFITEGIRDLEETARIMVSDRFSQLRIHRFVPVREKISLRYDVNLLEATLETDLSPEEIKQILLAVRMKQSFYRMEDGSFLDLEKNRKQLLLLETMQNYSVDGKTALLPMRQLLYLCAAAQREEFGDIEINDSVRRMAEEIKKIKAVIPPSLEQVLRDYQKKGIDWMTQLAEMDFGGILADDMGLGKTLQTLAFLEGRKPDRPALIVTPSSLTYNWRNETEKFLPGKRVLIIEGSREERVRLLKTAPEYDLVITSYPLLRRDILEYEWIQFSYIFIDEAQNIKNPKTMNARSVKRIRADYHFALTGTPIENSLTELWSIFDFIMPGYLGSLRDFKEFYEAPIIREGDEETMNELRTRIRPFILRRMKKEVLSELPEKIENTIYAELLPEQKKIYGAYQELAKNQALSIFAKEGAAGKIEVLTLLLRLRQICCHPALFDESYTKGSGKLTALEELLDSAIPGGHRVLVFSQFTSMLEILQRRLSEKGIGYFYLDGKTPVAERTRMVDAFNGGENPVFLISLRAGGAGLNLTGADMVVHYDPWWNPAVMDQASDRAHRIGQTRSVQVIRLAAKGTIEEKILRLQEQKRGLADDVITANHISMKDLTEDEIMSLMG